MANLRTLTITKAVEATNLPRATLYRLLESGAVAGNRVGKTWHISEASLESWISRQSAPAQAPAAPSVLVSRTDDETYSFM